MQQVVLHGGSGDEGSAEEMAVNNARLGREISRLRTKRLEIITKSVVY